MRVSECKPRARRIWWCEACPACSLPALPESWLASSYSLALCVHACEGWVYVLCARERERERERENPIHFPCAKQNLRNTYSSLLRPHLRLGLQIRPSQSLRTAADLQWVEDCCRVLAAKHDPWDRRMHLILPELTQLWYNCWKSFVNWGESWDPQLTRFLRKHGEEFMCLLCPLYFTTSVDLLSLAIITCPLPKLTHNNRQLKVWLSWCCLNNQLSEISMWLQLHMIWLIIELLMIQSSPFVAPEVMVVILSGNFIVGCSKFHHWWSHNQLFEQDNWSLNPL
jgi:hypothetical protein